MALCSMHAFGKLALSGATALCFMSSGNPSDAQPSAASSGTLTCTVADAPPNNPAKVMELSCNFKSRAGATSDYTGSAGTKTGAFPSAKFVLMWSVFAVESGKSPLLDGTFSAVAGREGPSALIGGEDSTIRLEPLTGEGQKAEPTEVTTLTLKLIATKT